MVYFPAPNSVPNNSATPAVTTGAPGRGAARQHGVLRYRAGDLDALADEHACGAVFT